MGLLPLSERDLGVLKEERDRLQDTYERCSEIFGPGAGPNAAKALDGINDAIEAIDAEIADRAGA
jgi:hypothetical protein